MARGRAQGRGQPVDHPNPEFMTLLLNIQHQLDDQAAMMQQQAEMIQNLQQQHGRVVEPELEEPEDEDVNMDFGDGNGGDGLGGNNVVDPPIGAPRGVEQRMGRNPQPQPV